MKFHVRVVDGKVWKVGWSRGEDVGLSPGGSVESEVSEPSDAYDTNPILGKLKLILRWTGKTE